MIFRTCLLAGLAALTALAAPADSRPRDREQEAAFRATRDGRVIPLRRIEALIIPRMRGFAYIGPEFEPDAGRYRLKFMRGQRVVWIDVDARTGEVIDRSGF
jgi:hypothetical protein